MELITMSRKEITRFEIIQRLSEHRINQKEAADILNVSVRQIQRLYASYRKHGTSGLTSNRRGKPSNYQLPLLLKQAIISLTSSNYKDFGPTLAREKLAEIHNIHVAKETLRKIMIEAGLWIPRAIRLKRAHQPRYRRECYGELIQIDGSEHRWFEDRGPKCTLLVFIDDATSKLMELQFVEEECTFSYFESTKRYIQNHGKPVAFYSDKLSVFRVNYKDPKGGDQVTQFGRALNELNIDIICANTCQAKGRVERANKTLQDRLVKELRLRNISSIKDGNEFLPEFISSYNSKFGKVANNSKDLHRGLLSHKELEDILCWKEERTVSYNLTIQYNKILYLLENTSENRMLARKHVIVFDYFDGEIKILYNNRIIPYSILHDKLQTINQGAIVENKRLGNVLAFIQAKQAELNCERSKSVPKRKRFCL